METIVLRELPFQIDRTELMKQLRVKEGSSYVNEFYHLVDEAQAIGRPKALYRLGFIEDKGDNTVNVEGTIFNSRVLRVNLEQAQRVFCFVATAGTELDAWAHQTHDMLRQFWAEAINEMVVGLALQALTTHFKEHYQIEQLSMMNPGSLPDWPLAEQRKLFAFVGDTKEAIGVELTGSLLMLPTKSVSGIQFPVAETFASCQLCPRDPCPNRRAPYDKDLFERKYQLLT